ncbi:MAG: hypothetical protein AAFY21_11085 [Cyanobacteria bacterium J06641_2]
MSKEQDKIKETSLPNARPKKTIPDYGSPERRDLGHNNGRNR